MACVVVFCTTYALILPAITMEQTYHCAMEPHAHTQDCYLTTTGTQFLCPQEQPSGHTHEGLCFDTSGALRCHLSEALPHTHEDSCYADSLHSHIEDCYDSSASLLCGLEEGAVVQTLVCPIAENHFHVHTESCIGSTTQDTLICTLQEHTHTDACQSDPDADVETEADWDAAVQAIPLTGDWAADVTAIAQSQIGYRESTRNYLYEEGLPRKGYTRYGAWYGIPYGDWDAMFVSFCLHYGQVPQEASSSMW